ncbi:MAG: 50S ribosomal protein L44e [Candidatus Woesearchaeota archaeon]|nr:50S ribosomal protein L44e [Candidatus Woesearchaeota archaeon]
MKIPKTINRYCRFCKKHTPHKVMQSKKKQPSSLTYGSKYRARKRGRARGQGGHGRYSKPAITSWSMAGKKQSKKTDLRYQCTVCKKSSVQRVGKRSKKVELI